MGNRRRLPSVHNIIGSKSSITLFWSSNSSKVVLSTAASRQSESADLGECMIANTLAESGRLAAVRGLAYEAADAGLLSPELAAGIRRVKGAKKLGIRLGNWLTAEEARRLWQSPAADPLKGKRDRAILAVLLGRGSDFDVANWLIWTSGICNSARSIGR
jgi:hypothetical protein